MGLGQLGAATATYGHASSSSETPIPNKTSNDSSKPQRSPSNETPYRCSYCFEYTSLKGPLLPKWTTSFLDVPGGSLPGCETKECPCNFPEHLRVGGTSWMKGGPIRANTAQRVDRSRSSRGRGCQAWGSCWGLVLGADEVGLLWLGLMPLSCSNRLTARGCYP